MSSGRPTVPIGTSKTCGRTARSISRDGASAAAQPLSGRHLAEGGLELRRQDRAGRDRVDRDPVAGRRLGQGFGEAVHGGLACRMVRPRRRRQGTGEAGDVHDAAPAGRAHPGSRRLVKRTAATTLRSNAAIHAATGVSSQVCFSPDPPALLTRISTPPSRRSLSLVICAIAASSSGRPSPRPFPRLARQSMPPPAVPDRDRGHGWRRGRLPPPAFARWSRRCRYCCR